MADNASLSPSPAAPDATSAVPSSGNDSGDPFDANHGLRAAAEPIFATLGDAEDASFGILTDLVDDLFASMRVAEENNSSFHVAVSYAWRQALEGCTLAAAPATQTLDAAADRGTDRRLGQLLRPRIDDTHEGGTKAHTTTRRRRLNVPLLPVLPFLTDLWTYLDRHSMAVETELAQFPSAQFLVSTVPTHGRQGEWQLATSDLAPFLNRVIATARLSVLGSAVDYIVSVNKSLLEKKAKAKAKLQLSQIMLCVQTALLQAEEAATATEELAMDDELVVYYDEGNDPPLLAIDRRASGNVSHKRELGSTSVKKQRMAKSIISLMQRRESDASKKWGALRKRLFVHDDKHVGIAVETDMELDTVPALQKTPTAAKLHASSPKKKLSVATSTTPRSSRLLSPSKTFTEPDAATLSNIFSLGTPRQLSPEELARRNDILSQLEREEAQSARKMAVATITSVTVPPECVGPDGKPILSEQDKAFQAYVAANSSVTMTGGSCVVPSAASGNAEPKRSRPVNDVLGKTKFELALESPRFDIADGNSHARMAAAAAAEAMNRKGRSRGGLKSPMSSPVSVEKTPSRPLEPHEPQSPTTHHPRPLETASGHLPQLDTSRLAVGVKAVVRGVEKRGPRHDPSRNSRLRLHNYMSNPSEDLGEQVPAKSPAKTPQNEKRDLLPPVSPIKASPHRKHVAFPPEITKTSSPQRPPAPVLDASSPVPPSGCRRFPAKQPTFEKRASPPRVRNRFLTENAQNPSRKKHFVRAKWEEREAQEDRTALNAPRRSLTHNDATADY